MISCSLNIKSLKKIKIYTEWMQILPVNGVDIQTTLCTYLYITELPLICKCLMWSLHPLPPLVQRLYIYIETFPFKPAILTVRWSVYYSQQRSCSNIVQIISHGHSINTDSSGPCISMSQEFIHLRTVRTGLLCNMTM